MQADERLAAGVRLLTPLMEAHGFSFTPLASGPGSGGWSASGEFRREDRAGLRRLELHYRHSLGLVTYHVDEGSLSHTDYMRALKANNQYPGFSTDPLDGFRHLLHDLEHYANDFLSGGDDEFARCLREVE
jgi:hypothetical protein